MKLKNSTTFSLIFLLIPIIVISQAELQSKIDRLLASKEFKHCGIGISVIDLEKGTTEAAINPDMGLIPASTLKVLTTLSALDLLGEDFQFETIISYNGIIEDDGTLVGDIIIEGGGDPTFGSEKFKADMNYKDLFKAIASKIQGLGITCIEGEIIADESIFISFPIAPSWQWNDLGNYYASGAWGININENEYAIYFDQRSGIGAKPRIKFTSPKVPFLNLSNEILVDSSHTGDNAYIFGGPYNYNKRIAGTIPKGTGTFRIKGSLPDPPYFSAYELSKALTSLGIQSYGPDVLHYKDPKAKQRIKIVSIKSPKLSEISKQANFKSNNLYCEAMLKMMGLKKNGHGTGQNGIAAIRSVLRKLKVDYKALHMEDGSGLSTRTNLSSNFLAEFLAEYGNKVGPEYLTEYLPQAGYNGTVAGMLRTSKARGNVWMKSGSMSRITNYAGIVKDANGKWKSFAILINNHEVKGSVMRAKVEKLIDYIYRY